MSPTQAALAHFRRKGFEAYITEKFIRTPKGGFRQDAFGFGDILIYHPHRKITALVQACIRTDMAKRRKKIVINPKAPGWIAAGNRIFISALAKRKPRGSKRIHYEVVIEEVVFDRSRIHFPLKEI